MGHTGEATEPRLTRRAGLGKGHAFSRHQEQVNPTAPGHKPVSGDAQTRQGRKDRAVRRRPFFLSTTLLRLPGLWLTAGRLCGCCGAPCHRPAAVVVVEAHPASRLGQPEPLGRCQSLGAGLTDGDRQS